MLDRPTSGVTYHRFDILMGGSLESKRFQCDHLFRDGALKPRQSFSETLASGEAPVLTLAIEGMTSSKRRVGFWQS